MDKVVAVLDVLGFKERLENEGHENLRKTYDVLKKTLDKREACMMLNCAVPVEGGRAAAFGMLDIGHELTSDSIFLWCSYSNFTFPPFCGVLIDLFCEVLELSIPLRGGVAVGTADMEKTTRTYLGKALNEAASVEVSQNWIGVSFGPSFAQPPYNWFEPDQVLVYLEHRKTNKADLIPGAVLDWPRKWRETRTIPASQIITKMNTNPNFRKYYENTITFIEFSEKNKSWFQGGGHMSVKS